MIDLYCYYCCAYDDCGDGCADADDVDVAKYDFWQLIDYVSDTALLQTLQTADDVLKAVAVGSALMSLNNQTLKIEDRLGEAIELLYS